MLLHDTCSIKIRETIGKFDSRPVREILYGDQPCEINPLNSVEASDAGPLVTYYRFITNVDVLAMFEEAVAFWKANPVAGGTTVSGVLVITYRTKTLSPQAGLELHRILGRNHHTEIIVKDFSSLGV